MKPTYFPTGASFRAWLAKNHASATEKWLGFYKTKAKKPGITYPEARDEALCFGWIDAVRRGIDDTHWAIRFTPRKPGSIWSAVNLARVADLTKKKRMRAAGLAIFAKRDPKKEMVYSFEAPRPGLGADAEKRLRANVKAWKYWTARPPSYRKPAAWWVVSAKKEETREKRLVTLIDCCARGVVIPPFKWASKR